MGFLNTIVELDGPVLQVEARWWSAHQAAAQAIGFAGPTRIDFWRQIRAGEPDGRIMALAKPAQVVEYSRVRAERLDDAELLALDELQAAAGPSLRVLKAMGACHAVTAGRNREAVNKTLDRLDIWMHFDRKVVLPADRDRRVEAIRALTTGHHATLAVVASVPVAYACNEAGCRVVGVKGGVSFPKQLQQVGVDACFESLDALTDALARRDPLLERIGLHF